MNVERLEQYRSLKCERKELESLRAQLLAKYEKLSEARAGELLAIENAIDSLSDPTQRRLLRLHYINGLSWLMVADRMHYSERWVYELRDKALEQLEGREPGN